MKFNYLETELSPIGCLAQDSLSGVTELEKGLITRDYVPEEKLSYWQLVFLQSKANGCSYQQGSSQNQLAVAQEHLVSGTAESL